MLITTAPGDLEAALARAKAGDTLVLAPGTYHERLVTRVPGLTIRAKGAVIQVSGRQDHDQNDGAVRLAHPRTHLIGLKVVGAPNTGIVLAADDLTVEGCEVVGARRHGISTDTARQTNYPGLQGTMIRRVKLLANHVHGCTLAGNGYGQAISLIADGFTVRGNDVHDNKDIGIDVWLGARHGEVVGNRCHANMAAGIYVDGAQDVKIHHNAVFRNKTGIGVSSEDPHYATRGIQVADNQVWGQRESGCFVWDAPGGPDGVQDVSFARNALTGNKVGFYLAGTGNTGELVDNAADGVALVDRSVASRFTLRGNRF
jgi:nitrous oxidase accessory protein NosD